MHHLDPVSVAIVAVSAILSPTLAEVAGPYAVIILGASLGASWSLGGRQATSRASALRFFLRMIVTATLATVGITQGICYLLELESKESYWMLTPVSILVGGIGDNWRSVVTWGVNLAAQWFGRRSGGA